MAIGEFVLWFVLAHAIVWAAIHVWVFFFGDHIASPGERSGAAKLWKRWLGRSDGRSEKRLGW